MPFRRVRQIQNARKSIKEHATKLIRDKEAKDTIGNDLLSLMIAENRKAEGKLAEMELVDQVMTFLLAGHETTSTAVIFFLTVLFCADNSWRGVYISCLSIRKYKNACDLKFNICTIQPLNKLNHVVI